MVFTPDQQKLFELYYQKILKGDQDEAKIVQWSDSMLQLMIDAGEAQVKHVHCKSVVPHKVNRNSSLMSALKVFRKGSKILGVGFSLPKCDPKRAVCFQKDPLNDRDVAKFVKRANKSPNFANFSANTIETYSVGCGHLNQFLCAIFDEVEVPLEFRSDEDLMGKLVGSDRLEKHDICKRDAKDLSMVLDKGLEWSVIPHRLEKKYPKLPEIFAQALNVEHNIGEGESWDEQFVSLSRSIIEHYESSTTKQPDYKKIMREKLQSKPARAVDVPSQMNFCK